MATKKTCDGCGTTIGPKKLDTRVIFLQRGTDSEELEFCDTCFDTTCSAIEVTVGKKPRSEWAGSLGREPISDASGE